MKFVRRSPGVVQVYQGKFSFYNVIDDDDDDDGSLLRA